MADATTHWLGRTVKVTMKRFLAGTDPIAHPKDFQASRLHPSDRIERALQVICCPS